MSRRLRTRYVAFDYLILSNIDAFPRGPIAIRLPHTIMVNPMDLPELREVIFDYLNPFDIRPVRLVCKTWYPEADQAFWGSAHNAAMLPRFLRLMPEDAWVEDRVSKMTSFWACLMSGTRSGRYLNSGEQQDSVARISYVYLCVLSIQCIAKPVKIALYP